MLFVCQCMIDPWCIISSMSTHSTTWKNAKLSFFAFSNYSRSTEVSAFIEFTGPIQAQKHFYANTIPKLLESCNCKRPCKQTGVHISLATCLPMFQSIFPSGCTIGSN